MSPEQIQAVKESLRRHDPAFMAAADQRLQELKKRKATLYEEFYPDGGQTVRVHAAIVDVLGNIGHMSVGLPMLTNLMAEFGALKVAADDMANSQLARLAAEQGESLSGEEALETREEIVERVCAELCEQVVSTFLDACTTLGLTQ